jgi:tetratricopeptide (TPR) repeat protein
MEASKKQADLLAQTTERLVGELISAKKLDEAEKLAREAMARGRTQHEKLSFWNHVCVVHQRKKTLAKLEKECATPKGKEPDPLKLLMLKAVYEAKQDPAKIVEINKEIVKRNPRDGMASRELAEHLVKQGKMKEALPILKSLAGNPGENRRKYAEMLVKHYLGAGKEEEAVKWAAVLKSPSTATYRKIIRLYVQAKKTDLAVAEYDEAIKNVESVDDACQLRLEKAKLLKREGKAEEAAKELKALTEVKGCPEHIAAEAKAALKAPAPKPKPAPAPKAK